MDLRTFVRCLAKGVEPEVLVRLDQLLHDKHRIGIPTLDNNHDIKFNEIKGTWVISSRGQTNVGTYISGTNDFGEYYRYGNVCHCRFGINGSITGLASGEINLISLPFPAILPWPNGNNQSIIIGHAANADNAQTIELEAALPSQSWAIMSPNLGNRTFGEYGHFWYFVNL